MLLYICVLIVSSRRRCPPLYGWAGSEVYKRRARPLRAWGDVSLHAWLHATGCGDAVPAFLALGLNGVALDGLALVIRGDAAALNHWLRTEAGIEPPSLRLRLVASLARLFAGVCAG